MTENKKGKRKIMKAAAIIIGIAALIFSFLSGFFIRTAIVGKDAAALSEIAAYLKEYGVFDSETTELKEFSAEDAARLITENAPDKYATYYSKEEYEAIKNNSSGKYEGVGISVYKDTLKIARVVINSPAFNSGIERGDILISATDARGNTTALNSIDDVNAFIDNLSENSFSFTVSRDGEEKTFAMKTEKYKSAYLLYKDNVSAYAYLGEYDDDLELKKTGEGIAALPENASYIRFDSFEGGAADELKGMLSLMKEKGKTRLILDVRGNGGGYMDVLSDFAGGIIYAEGKSNFALAYAKDSKGKFTEYNAGKNYFYSGIEKIAVIADEYSASATECLIGAMLYYGGAFSADRLIIENETIEGGIAKTFGKGIMQTTFMLSNGGAVKLTTAIVYQPDKITTIHGKGIAVSGINAVARSDNKALERAVFAIS